MLDRVPHHLDIRASLKEMGGGRMTQAVEGAASGDTNLPTGLLEGTVQFRRRDELIR